MSRACQVCGGLVFASNEVSGYGGPICNGAHGLTFNNNDYLLVRVNELEKRVAELTHRLSQQLPQTKAKKEVHQNATTPPQQ